VRAASAGSQWQPVEQCILQEQLLCSPGMKCLA